MRWTKDQLETLKTFHDKYKGSARNVEELATRIAKEIPTRTKGGIRTKLHRDYGDKTVRQLMKKIRLLPIRERQDLLATVQTFATPPKMTVSPYDLPSPPIPTIKEKPLVPTPPPLLPKTPKRVLQHSPPKEKVLTKFYKRLEGLYASPPKKKPKTKTRQQELQQRMRALGLRATRIPKSVEEVDIYEQLHQTDTQAKKRKEKEFQEKFVQAFHIQPADLLNLVKNPMKRTAGRKTRADTKKEQPIVGQVAVFYKGLGKDQGDVDAKLLTFLRLKLSQHEKILAEKERAQIRKQEEKIRQKHIKERMAELKGMTAKEWNEWQKTFKKDIKDKQEKEKERARIMGLDLSPDVKIAMMSMLEWPKAPTRKPVLKKTSYHTPSSSEGGEDDDDNGDGDEPVPKKRKLTLPM